MGIFEVIVTISLGVIMLIVIMTLGGAFDKNHEVTNNSSFAQIDKSLPKNRWIKIVIYEKEMIK